MPRVAIVTEAKASLPPDLCQELGIRTVGPAGAGHPQWPALLSQTLREAESVLCLTTAQSLGSSHLHAQEAARSPAGSPERVQVVDSGSTGIGLGLMALEAARLAQQGMALQEVAARCLELQSRLQMLGVLGSLDPLVASGLLPQAERWRQRIGEAYTGVFALQQGSVALLSTVHSRERSLERLVRQVTARCRLAPVHGGLMFSTPSDEVERVGELLAGRVNLVELHVVPMHPSLAQAVGPGCLSIAFYTSGG